MTSGLWLSSNAGAAIEPFLPRGKPGKTGGKLACQIRKINRALIRLLFGNQIEARIGPLKARHKHALASQHVPTIAEAISEIEARWPREQIEDCEDEPIFILACSWRSGSTLLQRLVVSSGKALIWGEPFALSGITQTLASSVLGFPPDKTPDSFFLNAQVKSELSDMWIANLWPDMRYFRQAHREFLHTLLARPAHDIGFARWGIKEVRLRAQHATFLRWLFPRCRIIFLYRNPYDAYRSYRRRRKWHPWYYSWPDDPVMAPRRFGEIWFDHVQGFIREAAGLGAFLLKYEELCSEPHKLDELSAYLGLELRHEVLTKCVGGLDKRGLPNSNCERDHLRRELRILRRSVEPLAGQLGYVW